MGCYWYCDCVFKTSDEVIAEKIRQEVQSEDGFEYTYVGYNNGFIQISEYEHHMYGFGEMFADLMSKIAEEYKLNGIMLINTDEDFGEPAQKTTFEHGKRVQWAAEVIYHRIGEV